MKILDLKENNGDPMKLALQFHEVMLTQKLILVYEGEINQEITSSFTALAERNLDESSDEDYSKYKRLYHVMVECLQNVCKHAYDSEVNFNKNKVKYGSGILMISQQDNNDFIVTTGNIIQDFKVEIIKSSIDKVNNMDKTEIKEYYKKKLKESRISEKGGAGLGFIDIVKKTGNKLEYSFEKINDEKSFFIVKSLIN